MSSDPRAWLRWSWTWILLIFPLSNPPQSLPTFTFSSPVPVLCLTSKSWWILRPPWAAGFSLVSIFWPLPSFSLLPDRLLLSFLMQLYFAFYIIWSEFLSYCIPGGKWAVDGWGKVVMAQIRGKRNAHKNRSCSSGNQCLRSSLTSVTQLRVGNELGTTHLKTIPLIAILSSPPPPPTCWKLQRKCRHLFLRKLCGCHFRMSPLTCGVVHCRCWLGKGNTGEKYTPHTHFRRCQVGYEENRSNNWLLKFKN